MTTKQQPGLAALCTAQRGAAALISYYYFTARAETD
jgi:hypothetical protein